MSHRRPFDGYHERREAEWAGAIVLIGVALALLSPGPTFSRTVYSAFAELAPEGTWGAALFSIAAFRMVGLWVNGSKRHSPMIRFVTAAVGASVWAWVAHLLASDGYLGLNIGVGAFGALSAIDAYCAFRAIWDQGRNDARAKIVRRLGRAEA